MTSAERRRLTAFIAGRRWASLAVICAALTGAALIVFMIARPEWVFRSPVLVLLLPVLIVAARCWRRWACAASFRPHTTRHFACLSPWKMASTCHG